MSSNSNASRTGNSDGAKIPAGKRSLHRLATVRRLQGISRRTMARHLNVELATVRRQERESTDLLLSELYAWQKVLDVPVAELLVPADDPLSEPVLKRSQLVRLMKTVLAILEIAEQEPIRRMAQTLVGQLTELMPELEGVSPWHAVGKRRRYDEFGVAAERRLPDDMFMDLTD